MKHGADMNAGGESPEQPANLEVKKFDRRSKGDFHEIAAQVSLLHHNALDIGEHLGHGDRAGKVRHLHHKLDQHHKGTFFVAMKGGRVIGLIALTKDESTNPKSVIIDTILLRSAHKAGSDSEIIVRALFQHAKDYARHELGHESTIRIYTKKGQSHHLHQYTAAPWNFQIEEKDDDKESTH